MVSISFKLAFSFAKDVSMWVKSETTFFFPNTRQRTLFALPFKKGNQPIRLFDAKTISIEI